MRFMTEIEYCWILSDIRYVAAALTRRLSQI